MEGHVDSGQRNRGGAAAEGERLAGPLAKLLVAHRRFGAGGGGLGQVCHLPFFERGEGFRKRVQRDQLARHHVPVGGNEQTNRKK